MAMKLTTGILAVAIMMTAGVCVPKVAAQNTDAIDNARSVAKSLQQKQTNDSNAALDAAGVPATSAKPAPGAPAPAVKPAVLPSSSKPAVPATAQAPAHPAVQPAATTSKPAASASTKPAAKRPAAKKAAVKVIAKTAKPAAKPAAKQAAKETKPAAVAAPAAEAAIKPVEAPAEPKPEDKKWAMNGKRDPFFSPVVQAQGSGCSTGKKCLEIGQINVRGVVKSENGFIAVVTNNLNKAYFLRENDPVFNGYVVRITGDSVVFQETVQDKLGKTSTREVVKRIYTPAV
jgi:Tfp pilus assembly protein PilP